MCFTGDISADKRLKRIKEKTQKHLDYYAHDGLRTLCIAKKVGEHQVLYMSIELLEKYSDYNSASDNQPDIAHLFVSIFSSFSSLWPNDGFLVSLKTFISVILIVTVADLLYSASKQETKSLQGSQPFSLMLGIQLLKILLSAWVRDHIQAPEKCSSTLRNCVLSAKQELSKGFTTSYFWVSALGHLYELLVLAVFSWKSLCYFKDDTVLYQFG